MCVGATTLQLSNLPKAHKNVGKVSMIFSSFCFGEVDVYQIPNGCMFFFSFSLGKCGWLPWGCKGMLAGLVKMESS